MKPEGKSGVVRPKSGVLVVDPRQLFSRTMEGFAISDLIVHPAIGLGAESEKKTRTPMKEPGRIWKTIGKPIGKPQENGGLIWFYGIDTL